MPIMNRKLHLVQLLWQSCEQDKLYTSKWPCIKHPFLLPDGRLISTDGKTLVVLDAGDLPEDYKSTLPVEEVLKHAMPEDGALPLDIDDVSDPLFMREWDIDEGEWVYFEAIEGLESCHLLKDGDTELYFPRSNLKKLNHLGPISYRLNPSHQSGTFFFRGGEMVVKACIPTEDAGKVKVSA